MLPDETIEPPGTAARNVSVELLFGTTPADHLVASFRDPFPPSQVLSMTLAYSGDAIVKVETIAEASARRWQRRRW
jgi:hypothetical protein